MHNGFFSGLPVSTKKLQDLAILPEQFALYLYPGFMTERMPERIFTRILAGIL
jgi:hypothetical protein